MKKKLVLVVAIVLIAITACACLVGCVPNRPDKYIGSWISSKHKAAVVDLGILGKTEFGIDGTKLQAKAGDKLLVIFEEKGDKLNMYVKTGDTWTASSITVEDAKKDKNGAYYEQIKKALNSDDAKESYKTMQEKFTELYEEKDGWWSLKADPTGLTPAMKVDGKELKMKTALGESTMMILDYKITIPSEAKAALK